MKYDKNGNELWKYNWVNPVNKKDGAVKYPCSIIEDQFSDVIVCLGGQNRWFPTTDIRIMKIDGISGKIIWQNQLSKKFNLNLIDCTIGGLVECGSYWLILNFTSIEDIPNNVKYISKSQEYNSPYNVVVIRIDRKGSTFKMFPKLSDEPLLVNYCEVDDLGNIICRGRKGEYKINSGLNPADRPELRWTFPNESLIGGKYNNELELIFSVDKNQFQ